MEISELENQNSEYALRKRPFSEGYSSATTKTFELKYLEQGTRVYFDIPGVDISDIYMEKFEKMLNDTLKKGRKLILIHVLTLKNNGSLKKRDVEIINGIRQSSKQQNHRAIILA